MSIGYQWVFKPQDLHDNARPVVLVILGFSVIHDFLLLWPDLHIHSLSDKPLLEAQVEDIRRIRVIIFTEWHDLSHILVVPPVEC